MGVKMLTLKTPKSPFFKEIKLTTSSVIDSGEDSFMQSQKAGQILFDSLSEQEKNEPKIIVTIAAKGNEDFRKKIKNFSTANVSNDFDCPRGRELKIMGPDITNRQKERVTDLIYYHFVIDNGKYYLGFCGGDWENNKLEYVQQELLTENATERKKELELLEKVKEKDPNTRIINDKYIISLVDELIESYNGYTCHPEAHEWTGINGLVTKTNFDTLTAAFTAEDPDEIMAMFHRMRVQPVTQDWGTRITEEEYQTLIDALPNRQTFEIEELPENTAPDVVQSPRTSSLTGNPASFHHHKQKEPPLPHGNKCSPQTSPESLFPGTLIKSH